jgi:hypothetical protein
MKSINSLFFIIVLLGSCTKDDSKIQIRSICLEGKWECLEYVDLFKGDTLDYFINGTRVKYWSGGKKFTSTGSIEWEFNSDSIRLIEQYDEYVPELYRDEYIKYELLNSTEVNNILSLDINGSIYYRICEFDDESFKIESMNSGFSSYYLFRRIGDCQGESISIGEMYKPYEIVGNWKLDNFIRYYNDDSTEYTKYSDNTYITCFLSWDYSSQVYYPEIDSSFYLNFLSIKEGGLYTTNETEDDENQIYDGTWCWEDIGSLNPTLFFIPVNLIPLPFTYQVKNVNEEKMILKYIPKTDNTDLFYQIDFELEYIKE